MVDNILVIYAHPNKEGNNGYILKKVEEEIGSSNYDLIDLYMDGFNPVLSNDELYTHGNKKISKGIEDYQKRFERADKLILIYPVWWNGAPAILKGFFDKLLTPGFGYYFKPIILKQGIPIKLFKEKKAVVFLTTTSNKLLYTLYSGRRPHRQAKKDLLGFLGIKTRVIHIDKCVSGINRDKIAKKVRKGVKKIKI